MTELVTVWNGREGWVGIGGEGYLNVEPEKRQAACEYPNRGLNWNAAKGPLVFDTMAARVLSAVTTTWVQVRDVQKVVEVSKPSIIKWLKHWHERGYLERMDTRAVTLRRGSPMRVYYRRKQAA